MHQDERGYLIVPREVATGADCDGCLMVVANGGVADLVCDCCGAVVDTVPTDRAGVRLIDLAPTRFVAPGVRAAERPTCFVASPSSKRSSVRNVARALM